MSILEHKDTLKNIRSNILKISHNKKAGHIASSFSILEILYVLFLNFDSLNDSLVLGK
jgi:transketolase N-terminal domain/subunit